MTKIALCRWSEDEESVWSTDCGEEFQFIDGGPAENKVRFCCYCGKVVQPKPAGDK